MATPKATGGAFGQAKIKRADKWDGWDVVRDADGKVICAVRFDEAA